MSRAQALTLTGLGLLALLAIGAGVVFVLGQSSDPTRAEPPVAPRHAVESPAPAAPAPIDADPGARTVVPKGNEADEPPPLALVSLRGRVVDTAGSPVPAIEVGVQVDEGDPPIRAKSDAGGSFLLAATALPCLVAVFDPQWTTVRMGQASVDAPLAPVLVVAARATNVGGIVVDPDGKPLAGARLGIRLDPRGPGAVAGESAIAFLGEWDTESAADGTFAFPRAPVLPGARLSTRLAEFETDERTIDLPPPAPLRIVLQPAPPEGPVLTGTVVRPDGSPVVGATVSFGSARSLSDIQGRFRLVCGWYDVATPLVAAARRSSPRILAGYGARVDRDVAQAPPERLVLPDVDLAITGRVQLANGGPAKGWRVALSDPTPLDPGGSSIETAEGQAGRRLEQRTDARGAFEFRGLAERPYTLLAYGRDRTSRVEVLVRSDPVPAGSTDVVLSAPDGGLGDPIRGIVQTSAGRPVEGARVGVGRPSLRGSGSEYGMQGRAHVLTDRDGRFEIDGVPAGSTFLVAVGETFLPVRLALESAKSRSGIVLHVRERREFSFDGSRSSPQPDLLRALAGGVPDPVWVLDAATPRPTDLLRLENGTTGPIAVGADVKELVLYRGCHEVGRVPLVLNADSSTRVVWP